jgi:hypothetical protein
MDVIVLKLLDACTNPGAQHEDSSYIRKQASGMKDRGSPVLAGKGKLMERLGQLTCKDCTSRYPNKEGNIGMSHISILHQVEITDRTMFVL